MTTLYDALRQADALLQDAGSQFIKASEELLKKEVQSALNPGGFR